ncbi:MAG: alginate lyase family protein [Hyphomicrobiaceae bacterium]
MASWASLALACLLAMPWQAEAQSLPPVAKPRLTACPAPPKPVRDLAIPRFYANAEGSTIDPKLAKLHEAAVAPLVEFLRAMVDAADKAVVRRNPEQVACALDWLQAWASADAWLGDMVTRQAEYQRKWDLAGIGLAYVKLRPYATREQRAVIEPWLKRWAAVARTFFDNPERKRNNHWYWLGLGIMATAVATDSPEHWQAARGIYEDALKDIRADGVLPHEMERQERGLFYHVFAMTPLVVMAEMAAQRGETWYDAHDGALHRLVGLCLDGLEKPQAFEALAGKLQEQPVNARAGWLSLYRSRFPERVGRRTLPSVPDKHRWLGGDVRLLMQAVASSR